MRSSGLALCGKILPRIGKKFAACSRTGRGKLLCVDQYSPAAYMTADRAHRGKIMATELAKALRRSSPHRDMSRGTSTIPPPPPKKPLTMPAAPPAMAAGIQGFQCFKAIALLRHSLPGEGVVYTWVKSRITVPARRNPATGGTQGALAGMERRPGGGASLCSASAGSSGEKTTLWWRIPRFFSSFRMTRARGHPSVLEMSATRN